MKEEAIQDSFEFASNVIQQYDNVPPKGLDIIFDYKVMDRQFHEEEARRVVSEFRYRNLDPVNAYITKIECQNDKIKRKKLTKKNQLSKIMTIDI